MLTTSQLADLKQKGYTVVNDVLTSAECTQYISVYNQWLSQFQHGDWPISSNSLIQRYRIGHMEPSWNVRIKSMKIFSQLWGTENLLTSFDGVAIGRPPEDGTEEFAESNRHWLHCDQSAERIGLHAYQAGVYLEHAEADDWTFEVLEGSHLLHTSFFDACPRAKIRSITNKHYGLRDDDVNWFLNHIGIVRKRVAVPRGGMVLWDSRLIHANARPVQGRRHAGRWRYVVFVCMAPANWASKEYIRKKGHAYSQMLMTSHWPCDELKAFSEAEPNSRVKIISKLPPVGQTDIARRLAGVLAYPENGKSPDLERPIWAGCKRISSPTHTLNRTLCCLALAILVALFVQLQYY